MDTGRRDDAGMMGPCHHSAGGHQDTGRWHVVSYQIFAASSDQCDEILTNCGVFVKCEYQPRPNQRCLFTMINFSTQFTFLCCSIKAAELSSLSVRASRKLKCVQTLSSSPPVPPPCPARMDCIGY